MSRGNGNKNNKSKAKRGVAIAALEIFKEIDPRGEDEESLSFKRKKVERKLQRAGFEDNSGHLTVLNRTYEAFLQQIQGNGNGNHPEEKKSGQTGEQKRVRYYTPNFSDCNADYIGYITEGELRHYVRVRLYDDGSLIRRCYPNENIYLTNLEDYLSVDWRINPKGRIYQISSLLNIRKERNVILLNVPCTAYLNPDWEWAPAYANEIPPKVGIMLPKLLEHEPLQRYDLLLQTGHELANEILRQLSAGTVKDPEKIDDTEKNLKDIVKNDDAMKQLDITAKLSPSVETSKNQGMITVVYN